SPGFFTSMVDAIPFYKTDAKSNLQVSAEVAQSYPNPNVDGVAYIDDFEGSRDSYSMGIFRESWTKASRPVGLDDDYYRSRMIWYNPYVQVPTSQIWEREVRAGESGSHTLRVEFTPHPSDTLIEVVDPVTSDTTEIFPNSWTGIMRSMSAGAINQERAQLLEFRVMGTQGIMHVELGAISEDVNGNGETDTEDKVDPISKMTDGIVDKDEDLGLDGLADIEEPGYDSETNPDPAGDNWWYNGYGDVKCDECTNDPNDYRFINGTQGNRNDPNRYGKPDTEDLDRGGDNDRQNAYFSYEVDLADDRFLVESSEYPKNISPENQWRTFRIPVRDPDALDMAYSQLTDADWARINYIRLWFEAPDEQPFTVSIAAADIIQSNWEDTLAILAQNEFVSPQSKFVVAAINNQENDDYKLDPPPGVTGFYDKTADIVEPEQSLLLKYENLNPGDTCIATRLFYDTPSYVGYRKLNMLVHGPADVDSIMFFFRLGDAEDRYYEYQTILKPGWHPDNEVNIDFNEITILKEYLLQAKAENPDTNEIIDGNYRVWGNPTLTRVKFLAVGVVNISKKNAAYYHPTGDIWINELKLLEVRRDVGMAARVAVSGNMADLFTYRANYEYQNSYFQKLSSSSGSGANLGSGKTSTTYSTGVSLNLNKLLPRSLGASIPISVSYSKRTIVPRLKTNSDIVLPPELQEEESTISESRSFSISESFSLRTRNPLFTLIINPLKTSFSYSRVEGRSPQRPSSFTETYHIKGSHSFKFSKVPSIKPLFWTSPVPIIKKLSETKLYFFPKSITSSGNFDRNLSISENSSGVVSQTLKRTFVGDMKFIYDISNNLKSNFSMNTKRDLNDPDKIKITLNPKTFKLGRETSYSQRFGATYGFSLFSFLSHNFIYSADYRESRDVRDSTRNINSTKSYGVNGSFEHQKLFNFGLVKKDDSRSNRKRRGRRAPIKKDSIVVEVKEHKSLKVRILTPVSKVLTALTSWLRPIGYEFSERYSYAYTGVTERAKFAFQFGFSDEIGVPVKSSMTGSTRSTSVTKATNYSFRTGTIFFGGLKTDISFSRKINQDIIKTTNRNKVVATTFPDISFTINELRTFKFLNSFIRKFRPRTAFSRSVDKSYNLQTGFQTTEKSSIRQNPILGLSANVLGGVQLTFSTDRSVSESKSLNSQNGSISSRSRST
ncbi:MAG: cell surface protein SprA, partial [candidate division Zixibacteria bacterium]|nr:cell surface protein SprA [candidate division Zixibacteria bacterium]